MVKRHIQAAHIQVLSYQSFLRFDERPVDPVHLVVEATGVTEVVARAISAPQWCGDGAAVDAFPALGGHVLHQI